MCRRRVPAQEEHTERVEEEADDPNSDLILEVIWKEELEWYLVLVSR